MTVSLSVRQSSNTENMTGRGIPYIHGFSHERRRVWVWFSGTSLIQTPLEQKKVSLLGSPLLVSCPDKKIFSGVVMYINRVFGTAKRVLFIEVSSFQGVLRLH